MSIPNATPKTLGEIAINAAVKAAANDDSASFTATVALALVMANRQMENAETDKAIVDTENGKVFRMFLKRYANKGLPVWRNSDDILARIVVLKGKERETAVSHYIDGGKKADKNFAKPEGAKYGEGIAKLRKWSFKLMDDVVTNHAAIIRDILSKKQSGASGEALADIFTQFVRDTYGKSFAKLTERLSADTVKKEHDVTESILKRARAMPDVELSQLIAALESIRLERANTDATMGEMFGDAAIQPPAPAEAPELIKAVA